MSGVLLDTHVALWLLGAPDRFGAKTRALLTADPLWVSAASLWEVAIKSRLGRLTLDGDIAQALADSGVRELPVTWRHITAYGEVDLPHRDPFDAILVSQAREEGFRFLTVDRAILSAGLPFVADAAE